MRAHLRLLRPGNGAMSALAVAIGAIVAVGWEDALARSLFVALGLLVALLFTGAGNALNDVFDREVDRVNHPERPIPRGDVSPAQAFDLALALFGAALLLGLFINLAAFGVVLLSFVLMVSYEARFKASGWSGNLLIGWLVGSLFLFGGLCVYEGELRPLQVSAALALLAGLSTVGREVVKDIEDVAGDVGRTTLPKARGVPFAGRVAQGFLFAAVALSAVPALFGVLGLAYVPVVAVADGIFIYAALHSTRSPGRSERAMKAAMVVALLAFLAGGLG